MRSADKTKAECLKIWQDKWQDVFKNGKLTNMFGERDEQLEYIEKMIKVSENAEYEFRFKYQSNEEIKEFICYAKNEQLAQLKYETFLNENVL